MLGKLIKILPLFAVLSMFFAFGACSGDEKPTQQSKILTEKQKKDIIEKINKQLISQEKEAINKYIEKSGNNFAETGTGLRYYIVNQGDGEPIKLGDIVAMKYEKRLLNGDIVESSEENGNKVFVVGHGGVESGLEEAILLLHKGDEAEIVIPSRLAYGLTGDGDKIPCMATLVYKLKVIEHQTNY